jgi:hypothetical protein
MDKAAIANRVATKLFATENAIDTAMVEAALLIESMVHARRDLGVSAVTAEVAQSRVAEAIAAISEARRAVIAAHGALAQAEAKLGIEERTVMGGDKYGSSNASATMEPTTATLRVAV